MPDQLLPISRERFTAVCPKESLPSTRTDAAYYTCGEGEFVAAIFREHDGDWGYAVYRMDDGETREVAKAYGYDNRPEPALRGKLNELVLKAAVEARFRVMPAPSKAPRRVAV